MIYNQVVSGGLSLAVQSFDGLSAQGLGATADVFVIYNPFFAAASSGGGVNGAAAVNEYNEFGDGGIEAAGAVEEQATYNIEGDGGIEAAGVANHNVNDIVEGDGGIEAAGVGEISVTYSLDTSGGVGVAGVAESNVSDDIEGDGGIEAAGVGNVQGIYTPKTLDSPICGQTEADYTAGELTGTFSGGLLHAVSDVIVLEGGVNVTVDAVDGSGTVTGFTITKSGFGKGKNATYSQTGTSGSGIIFSLTTDDFNQAPVKGTKGGGGAVNTVILFVTGGGVGLGANSFADVSLVHNLIVSGGIEGAGLAGIEVTDEVGTPQVPGLGIVVPALPANNCRGEQQNSVTGVITPDIKFKCLKEVDQQGKEVFTCTAMKKFFVKCPKLNQQCNTLSSAFVAAVTVCNQRLF